jgi:asparaginyl-tRNA synthetase
MTPSIRTLGQHIDQTVTLKGWVGHKRKTGQVRFMMLRDGSAVVQLVLQKESVAEPVWQLFSELKQESSVIVQGRVRKEERALGRVEVDVTDLRAVHIPTQDFPIGHKEHGPDFLLNERHLWLRSRKQSAIMRVRHVACEAIREHLNAQEFYETPAPIFTPNACEGTSTLFSVPYFDLGEVYLSQSGQLYGEALAMALGKIYSFTPAFRAEKSKTRKHLTEFWMVEPEMAWYDHEMNLALIESTVRYVVQRCLERCQTDLGYLERDVSKLEKALQPFKRMTYRQALEWLTQQGRTLKFGDDLGAEDETMIGTHWEVPVFITHYPTASRAFYMKVEEGDPAVVRNCDLIAPEGFGEIVGGSEREERMDVLVERLEAHGLDKNLFEWYLDLRRFGSVPHSGFGLGIERTVAWICGAPHVRECIPFPRMIYRVQP